MTQCTATFETGTNGNTITTGDAGSATAWDTVTIVSGGTCVYDNTNVANGLLAAKVATAGTGGTGILLRWVAALGTVTDHYGRFYFYGTAFPGTTFAPVVATTTTDSVTACKINLDTAGKLHAIQGGATEKGTMTNAIALNQLVRIEYHFIHSATVGQMEIKLFNTATSTTDTETLTTTANLNTQTNADGLRFGLNSPAASTGPYWFDDIVAGANSYPGPVVTAATDIYLSMGELGTGRI